MMTMIIVMIESGLTHTQETGRINQGSPFAGNSVMVKHSKGKRARLYRCPGNIPRTI